MDVSWAVCEELRGSWALFTKLQSEKVFRIDQPKLIDQKAVINYPRGYSSLIVSSSTIDKIYEITLFTKIGTKSTLFTKKVRNFRKKCKFCTYFCV